MTHEAIGDEGRPTPPTLSRPATSSGAPGTDLAQHSVLRPSSLLGLLLALFCGAALIALLFQIPAQHRVDIGGFDAAYVQGFYDPQFADDPGGPFPYLAGSDGSARWTRASSALLFPQAGLPGRVTLRLRGWRAAEAPPQVQVLLNGSQPLARFTTTGDWEEHSFVIDNGLLKASDFFIELRADTTRLPDDGRDVGVLLDQAEYTVAPGARGFITPYPSQVAYGALAAALIWLLDFRFWMLGRRRHQSKLQHLQSKSAALLLVGLLFLLLYRLQPPFYPYPLRWLLPGIDLVLLAALLLRHGPVLAARFPVLLRALVPLGVALWTGVLLLVAREHVTLSLPGVENDFRVFALRSVRLLGTFQPDGSYNVGNDGVLRADGFYNLGYPFLIWLLRPLTADNPFLAARLVAVLSGAVLLAAAYLLARSLLPRSGVPAAMLILAFSPLLVQYGLYLGTDMPFAACVTLTLALLALATRTHLNRKERKERDEKGETSLSDAAESPSLRVGEGLGRGVSSNNPPPDSLQWQAFAGVFAAGCAAGCAFLMRHMGLLLLAWGVLHLLALGVTGRRSAARSGVAHWFAAYGRLPAAYCLGFLIVAAPQLAINTIQTGQPLYNQQAKNVWLAVYGGTDWGRWGQAHNDITLAEVALRDPARFLGNWWHNLIGFVGSGAEDTSEFGRAFQLRLLGWPANWLALAGLGVWIFDGLRRCRRARAHDPHVFIRNSLLLFLALYVVAVSMAFPLQRFFLPLAPLYAVAAAWLICAVAKTAQHAAQTAQLASLPPIAEQEPVVHRPSSVVHRLCSPLFILLALLVLLWNGFAVGTAYVLNNQPADEVAVARLVMTTLRPDERLLAQVETGTQVVKYSAIMHQLAPWPTAPNQRDALAQARAQGIRYLLWDETPGPPPLPDPGAARVGSAGGYSLYRL